MTYFVVSNLKFSLNCWKRLDPNRNDNDNAESPYILFRHPFDFEIWSDQSRTF